MTADTQPETQLMSAPSGASGEPPRRGDRLAGGGGESLATSETRQLLQARLRMAAVALLIVVGAFAARGYFVDSRFARPGVGVGLAVLLAAAVVFLYRGRNLSLGQLRGAEFVVFGVPAFQIVYDNYMQILVMARVEDVAMVVVEMQSTTLSFFALITFYGMFVPNSVRRASILIGGFGTVFVLLLPVMSFHDPQAWAFIWQTVDIEQRSAMVMMILFGVGISITASSIIHSLRGEVIEAKQMGQYDLTELIGKGGMGEVWRAEHALLARPAAVKLIRPEVLDPNNAEKADQMIRRFEREAQNTANLRSVHTIELYDFGITDSGTLYYVMELLEGIDLETMTNKHGPLSPARTRYLIRQVCESLAEAHAQGLVHRDIKPANILCCRLGGSYDFAKVLDFGLSKAREPEPGTAEAKLTGEGMVIGTPAYMPPETVTKGISDARSDIYALGCVMYWMLTGQLVFEGAHAMSMVVRHVQDVPEPPSAHSEIEIPSAIDRVVLACLEKKPEARPQTATEVRLMLDQCELEDTWTDADAEAWWAQQD